MNQDTGSGGSPSAELPTLFETGNGSSVLYRDRALYSRYNPSRNPVTAAQSVKILPATLILCPSPVLGYGLDVLLGRLPPECLVLGLESDESLMALSVGALPEKVLRDARFRYVRTASSAKVLEYVDGLALPPFRRCMRLDLSAGATLDPDFYRETVRLVDGYISKYWHNHAILMKLGRNYARNFFRNLPRLCSSGGIGNATVSKPVFVAGAGPSLDGSIPFIRAHRESLFVLAVDTALKPLGDAGITPDAVVLVESQFWIERAFAGFRDSRIPLFADLTARPAAIQATGGSCHFFLSDYARVAYIERFLACGVPLPVIPPLGSVGLVALHLARIVSRDEYPVFFTGLDFSWGAGMTHSRGAPSASGTHNGSDRLCPALSAAPSLAPGVHAVTGKNGSPVFTDPVLSGYAELCADTFSGLRPPYLDIGKTGLDTGLVRVSFEEADEILSAIPQTPQADAHGADPAPSVSPNGKFSPIAGREVILDFLESEGKKLELVRDLLTGESKADDAGAILEKTIREADYLFAHFPDAYKGYSPNPAFLKRVRVELEYFLKTIRIARNELES